MRIEQILPHIVALTVTVLLAAPPVLAQDAGITGLVTDETGAVLPGVTIEAERTDATGFVSRIAVTDGTGRFTIIQLPSGVYTATFTLPGFSTFVREGLELSAGFTATANAELAVGGLEETITVSGASPLVDIQNSRAQEVFGREFIDSVPRGKGYGGLQSITVGAIGSNITPTGGRDVGGSRGDGYSGAMQIHGTADGKLSIDGAPTSFRGGRMTLFHINNTTIQEIVVDTGGNTAETQYGGSSVRVLTKDGGNTFSGSFLGEYAPTSWQSENLSSDLEARGLTTAPKIKLLYDVGGSFGGPIVRDKMWFYSGHRLWESQEELAGVFQDKNQGVFPYIYEADLDNPAFTKAFDRDNQVKITWQATEKQKFSYNHIIQRNCGCFFGLGSFFTPAATFGHYFEGPNGGQHMMIGTYTFPATNNLLFEARGHWWIADNRVEAAAGLGDDDIAIFDAGRGILYGQLFTTNPAGTIVSWVNTQGNHGDQGNSSLDFKLSYVTGSHTFKTGVQVVKPRYDEFSTGPLYSPPIQYWYLNAVPFGLSQLASPNDMKANMTDFGLFAQDAWTIDRLTVNMGIRYDANTSSARAFTRPGGFFLDAIDFPAIDGFSDFKDIAPRIGLAYDIFGTGQTALKFNVGKNMLNEGLTRALATHPANALTGQANRPWNDSVAVAGGIPGDFIPQCDLKNNDANGECGPLSGLAFGTPVTTVGYADDAKGGWGNRDHTWVISALFEHEIRPGLGVTFGYYRTTYGNLITNDNRAVDRNDFTEYSFVSPVDSRLPDGGGQVVSSNFDVNPDKRGQIDFLRVLSNNTNVYNGFDLLVNARFDNGATLQGGFNTGETIIDNCDVPDAPGQFCRRANPGWSGQSNIKLQGQYPLPWYNLVVSGTFLNLPGIVAGARSSIGNAEIFPSLGRNLSACGLSATAPFDPTCTSRVTRFLFPQSDNFEERQTQVDLRIGAAIDVGGYRLQPRLEIFNLFNAADVQGLNNFLGATYLNASSALTPRIFKVGFAMDF